MYLPVTAVEPLPDYCLLLTFAGRERRIFDLKPHLGKGMFQALKDESLFRSVHIAFDTIAWANGADFDPEALYEASTPQDGEPGEPLVAGRFRPTQQQPRNASVD